MSSWWWMYNKVLYFCLTQELYWLYNIINNSQYWSPSCSNLDFLLRYMYNVHPWVLLFIVWPLLLLLDCAARGNLSYLFLNFLVSILVDILFIYVMSCHVMSSVWSWKLVIVAYKKLMVGECLFFVSLYSYSFYIIPMIDVENEMCIFMVAMSE